jgi:hypothetical protein
VAPGVGTPTAGDRRHRIAYVLAPSHSGSTLLAMLLASHPQVTTVGELNLSAVDDPDHYPCSCGAKLRECDFWRRVSSRVERSGHAFDVTRAGTDFRAVESALARRLLRPLHRGPALETLRDTALACIPAWRAAVQRAQQANAALVGAVLGETGARVIVDSSKIGLRLKFLLRNPALDVRVIRLVRDGRAVALTYTDPARYADAQDPALRGGGTGGHREAERLPIEAAAHEWRRSHEEGLALVRGLAPSTWIEVRYEALCLETEATLRRVFAHLDVDRDRPRANFRDRALHVVGNGMRLDTGRAVTLDDRWTTALSANDRRAFDSVAGALNRRFGYEG